MNSGETHPTNEPINAPHGLAVEERRFAAMGTRVHIMVVAARDAATAIADLAAHRVDELEARWSRFRPTSEVSAVNQAAGTAVAVSAETIELFTKAIAAWELTEGAFDPTVLHALEASGYDRSFDIIDTYAPAPDAGDQDSHATPGCDGIVVAIDEGTVTVPQGVGFDPGGIGKGLGADLIATEAMADGACGVLVSLGGDAVARGQSPAGDGWTVAIDEDTISPDPIATLAFTEGAVATSVTTRRTWGSEGDQRHHLVDPATGTATETNVILVSVLAPEGWLAEAVTKSHLTGSVASDLTSVPALVMRSDGTLEAHGGMDQFLAATTAASGRSEERS